MPKPMASAWWSPVTSPKRRGYASSLDQPLMCQCCCGSELAVVKCLPLTVSHAVGICVGQQTRMLDFGWSAARAGAEIWYLESLRGEVSATGGQRHLGSGRAEGDNVRHAVTVHVRELAWLLILGAGAAAEILSDLTLFEGSG